MTLAWLLLVTGLTISAVAIYYSVVGLAAIFSAAVIPIIVMGSALEIAKLVCASWLKANWSKAPVLLKTYMTIAVVVLMLITSMGIFGFLSKAHSDQSLVSGDVQSKISIYDEKIRTAKDNIEANRKALKQMDEAVDQVMGRSSDEKGADKAVAIRRGQQKERTRLQAEIASEQKLINQLNEEAAPIRAEVRKVEAEVGPLKYIAKFIYGDNTDENMLEKAVTWVIILIVVVFDPLAVIMLLAAQMTFAWTRKEEVVPAVVPVVDIVSPETTSNYEQDDGALTDEQLEQINAMLAENAVKAETILPKTALFKDNGEHPKDTYEYEHTEEVNPETTPSTALGGDITAPEETTVDRLDSVATRDEEIGIPREVKEAVAETYHPVEKINFPANPVIGQQFSIDQDGENKFYIWNGVDWIYTPANGQSLDIERPGDYLTKTEFTEVVEPEGSKKKSYMTKDESGHQAIKTRD
jgi:hypothetical protein